MENINETKVDSWKKISKIDKSLLRLEKRERKRSQITKIKNESGVITTTSTEINMFYSHTIVGIHSGKCVLRQFCHCAKMECTYTNLDSIAYYMFRLYGLLPLGYKPIQRVTVQIHTRLSQT